MLPGVGFRTEDFATPMIGIASGWSMVTPRNMHFTHEARAGRFH